jgi:hypothetical protein
VIYRVEGNVFSLDHFDPLLDLLLDRYVYLTWRHVKQPVVAHSRARLYAGADYRSRNWLVYRLNPEFAYEGVEQWLARCAQHTPGSHLGFNEGSKFRGLLGPLSINNPVGDLKNRGELIDELVDLGVIPRREPMTLHLNSLSHWDALRGYVINCLLPSRQLA